MTQTKTSIITATYRIVTPMFCAGADQNSAELRLPSFKGALRFWWRTLMWGKVTDHSELRNREAELFGASDSKVGRSKLSLRITERRLLDAVEVSHQVKHIFEDGRLLGAHYLGYGVMEASNSPKGTNAGQLKRGMTPGGKFTVKCRLAPLATQQQIDQIRRAMVLLGTVGGLGSKSRKGFGSLTITQLLLDGDETELSSDAAERLRSAVVGFPETLPAWTAWSRDVRIVIARSDNVMRSVELLDQVGREEVLFRSYGSNNRGKLSEHRTLGMPSEQNFKFDHDLSKQPRQGQYPHRVAFGLPHNYQNGGVNPSGHDRRASPLFIHIDQSSEAEAPVALLAFLPSEFLEAGEPLNAFGNTANLTQYDELWYPVHAFLDRLVNNEGKPKSRPGYEHFPNGCTWWEKKTSLSAKEVKLD